jgi:diguanylate cyclase (GGDEF)-like protein
VLIAAHALVPHLAGVPASLSGLVAQGTYAILALALALAVAFRRGRVVFALLTLVITHAVHVRYLQADVPKGTVFAVFGALCLFVPLNLAALSLLKERGTFNRHGLARCAVVALEVVLAAWLALPGNSAAREWLYAPLIARAPWGATPVPQLALVIMALSVLTAGVAWHRSRSAIDLALASAAVAFVIAAHRVTTPHAFTLFVAAGALLLAVAVLQDTFRMAFRDELTGLPSRRALNERLAGLGRHFTVAMVDVDHFKTLNDTHGHDVGDQVLKLVASRLARVGGGGEAYRFGGEEFTLLFPDRGISDALPCLEAVRTDIAEYRMEMRRSERTAPGRSPKGRRPTRAPAAVSVTISIGVAESGARPGDPDAVVQAADKALYRAKDKGRNRVSR